MKMNIRCCCDCRLIGRVDIPEEMKKGETWITPNGLSFEIDSVFLNSFSNYELALKSRDYPIEKMREIPGFEERRRDE